VASGRSVMVTVAGPDGGPGREYEFAPEDFAVETHQREGFQVEREGGVAVAISTVLSAELMQEGLARELVHHIQNTRKAADFQIDDRINLRMAGPREVAEMLAVHGDWVKKETLALSLEVSETAAEGVEPTAAVARGAAGGTPGGVPTTAETAVSATQPLPGGAYREALKVNGLPVTVEVAKA